MRVISVVGARPQFVKLAPVAKAARSAGIDHATVHTGQHYDHGMSQVFFEELGIGEPEWNLEVGSGSHGVQTGAMLAKLRRTVRPRAARLGPRLRRHQLHARRDAGCGKAASASRASRSGTPLVQPGHARRTQPSPHRSRCGPAPRSHRHRGRPSRRRGTCRPHPGGRRRDGRRPARRRPAPRRRPTPGRSTPDLALCPRDDPPGREHRRSDPPRLGHRRTCVHRCPRGSPPSPAAPRPLRGSRHLPGGREPQSD